MKLSYWPKYMIARWYHLVGATHRHIGNAYGLRVQYEAAVDDFTRALCWDPNFAQAYLDRGILYWRELDHPRRAILDLTTAVTIDPNLSEALFNRGVAYQQLREYAEAIADFQAYLSEGKHPYWRRYAETMVRELSEWVHNVEAAN